MKKLKKTLAVLGLVFFAALVPAEAKAAPETKLEAGEETDGETKAKSLSLELSEGEVLVKNAKGKEVELREGAKLYNGYEITTGEGYAWLSLDDTKLIKLDWNSRVTVKKNGRKLEVLLESGSLFFNISEPLAEDETLDIRSSTMSTGIRGTLGKLSIQRSSDFMDTKAVSSAELYEGKLAISYHEEDGDVVLKEMESGSREDVKTRRKDCDEAVFAPLSQGEYAEISVKDALMECGFIAIEVKNDPDLQERLLQGDNDIDEKGLQEIIDHAEEQLARDQEEHRRQAAEIEEELKKVKENYASRVDGPVMDQVFGEKTQLPGFPEEEPLFEEQEPLEEENTEELQEEEVTENRQETEEAESKEEASEAENSGSGNSGSENSGSENSGSESDGSESGGSESNGSENGDNDESDSDSTPDPNPGTDPDPTPNPAPDPDPTPDPEPEKQTFTVSFETADGKPFASWSVKEGETVKKPILMPGAAGVWQLDGQDYSFDAAVTANLTLRWKQTDGAGA